MHIGHGVDRVRLEPVLPRMCALKLPKEEVFAKVQQNEMTSKMSSMSKQSGLTCLSDHRCHHCAPLLLLFSLQRLWKKTTPSLHVMCICGFMSSWWKHLHACRWFWACDSFKREKQERYYVINVRIITLLDSCHRNQHTLFPVE